MSDNLGTTIENIKARNIEIGSHFFDKDTMRYFGSRVSAVTFTTPGTQDTYFVTSERDRDYGHGAAWNGERRYTVRAEYGDGKIHTISDFGEYGTLVEAKQAAAFQTGNTAPQEG